MDRIHQPNRDDELLEQATCAMRNAPALGDLPAEQLLQTIQAASRDAANQARSQPHWFINRIKTMKSMYKVAASILLVVGIACVTWAVLRPTPAMAFANIAQQLRDAQTMTADLVIKQPSMTMKGKILYLAPGHVRIEMAGAPPEIVDQQTGRIVLRDDANKNVLVMQIDQKGQKANNAAAASVNWIEGLRNISRNAGKPVGEADVGGVRAQQFDVLQQNNQKVSIFADARTGTPLRIETSATVGGQFVTMTLEHIALGQPLAASLFDIEIPAGYTQQQTTASAEPISESDVVKFIDDYANRNGVFPPSLRDFDKNTGIGSHTMMKPQPGKPTSLPSPEFFEAVLKATRAMMFLNQLPATADWHYAGSEVKKGDAATPIFWYRASVDATSYRVIYADLHIADVAATDVPQNANAEAQK